jgi:hypothetical protein
MIAMCILLRLGHKYTNDRFSMELAQRYAKENNLPEADVVFKRKELIKKLFEFCVPFIEKLHMNMNITELSMSLRSLDAFNLLQADAVNNILLG